MAKPTKPDRPGSWFSREQMADALDVSLGFFDREVKRLARPEHTRKRGRKTFYKARPLIEAYLASQLEPPTPVDDAILLLDLPAGRHSI